jgi:eukaryotic-like serine/threonine-protein kinase
MRDLMAYNQSEQAMNAGAYDLPAPASEAGKAALGIIRNPFVLSDVAFVDAMIGKSAEANSLMSEALKLRPDDTLLRTVWMPAMVAWSQIRAGAAGGAIQTLQPAADYDGSIIPVLYTRAVAYLRAGRPADALQQFERILKLKGIILFPPVEGAPFLPLAQLGIARAYGAQSDKANARHAYQDFFALWKDADTDIPILISAKSEYAKLE